MNAAAFAVLDKAYPLHYAGPINPPPILWQKVVSKALRVAGSQGDFFFFSQRRLEAIAEEVRSQCRPEARLDFFHGFTPWVLTKPERPYVAWSDCTFRDYIDIFHCRNQFRCKDLERIEVAEAIWLRKAQVVGFRSQWAAERALSHYALDAKRVVDVGGFGEITVPTCDRYDGGKSFVFVSTNFEAKGGPVVLRAFRQVKKRHPDASLSIIGALPSKASAEAGIELAGYLHKEVPTETELFRKILSRARALVHPTTKDVSPLIIIEAGYFGCPAISTRNFAIPELVDHGRTGLLLDDPSEVNAVADAMNWMLEHEYEYQMMRKATWANAHGQHSRGRFEERIVSCVSAILSDG